MDEGKRPNGRITLIVPAIDRKVKAQTDWAVVNLRPRKPDNQVA
jgi:hypothetical protein